MAAICGYEWETDLNPDFLQVRFDEKYQGTIGVRDHRKASWPKAGKNTGLWNRSTSI